MKYIIKIIYHGEKNFLCNESNKLMGSKHPFKTPEIIKFDTIENTLRHIRHMKFWKSEKQIVITRNDGTEFKLSEAKKVCKLVDK
jgi:hypothetical protein